LPTAEEADRALKPLMQGQTREILLAPRQLLKKLRQDLFDYQSNARRILDESDDPSGVITCSSGCAFCCYQKIITEGGTGAMIYLHLKLEGRWSETLERRLLEADRAMTAETHAEWMTTPRPCVFLKQESFGRGHCTIYATRPLPCVITFSKVRDPIECSVVGGKAQFLAHFEKPAEVIAEKYKTILRNAGEEQAWLMTLPGAVLYGRALLEGLPRPAVRRIGYETHLDSPRTVDEIFDDLQVTE
jgi:Fe-S-cluster containining protein